jgi:hypothetical protein
MDWWKEFFVLLAIEIVDFIPKIVNLSPFYENYEFFKLDFYKPLNLPPTLVTKLSSSNSKIDQTLTRYMFGSNAVYCGPVAIST